MNIIVITIGRPLKPVLQALVSDYSSRIKPWAHIDWHIITADKNKDATIAKNKDSQKIRNSIKYSDYVIVLDEGGKQYNNVSFASNLVDISHSNKQIVFVIGGAYGVNEELKNRADLNWSLSPLVFPHELVRVMLIEQIYRSLAIMHNHPYHHGS